MAKKEKAEASYADDEDEEEKALKKRLEEKKKERIAVAKNVGKKG